jgi:hypothetical protein
MRLHGRYNQEFSEPVKTGHCFPRPLVGSSTLTRPTILTFLKLTGPGRPLLGRASSDIFDSSTPHFASFSEQFGYDECTRVLALNRGGMPRS